jgi:hypothetical protein
VSTPTVTEATEHEAHRFCIDASDLCLPPGAAPQTIGTTLGNRQPFVLERRDPDGTLHYRQSLGCITLTIFND